MPNLIAMAAETSAPGIRNRSVGIAYIGMPIGGSLASVLAFFIPSESWRELFRVGGLAPLLLVPALMYFLPDKRSAATSRSQALGFADSAQQLLGNGRAAQTLLLWLSFFLIVLTLHLMLNWLPFLLTARGLTRDSAMLAQAGFGIGGAVIALKQAALLDSARRGASILISIGVLPLVLVCAALLPAWPSALILTSLLLGGAILAQQVIVYAAGSVLYADEARHRARSRRGCGPSGLARRSVVFRGIACKWSQCHPGLARRVAYRARLWGLCGDCVADSALTVSSSRSQSGF